MNKEERLVERERLLSLKIQFGDNGFEQHFNKILETYTPEELLNELKECGLEVDEDENKKE